jgi:hypothetical protein
MMGASFHPTMRLPPTVRPILERLAYVFYFVVLVCSIGFTWLGGMMGWITGNYTALLVAMAGLVLSRWLHIQGFTHWHFRECEDGMNAVETGASWPRPDREEALAGEIEQLFTRLDAEADVWARGDLRREIATRLATAPALREEFAENLADHPEL